ncbi:peptidase S24 [Micromonospora sp. PPF5-17]|uniref:Peptidase S24 n=1 Tax=Micromonospora solifontis TaxID=2487138 RepID=A0ABX9WEV9_9ACTN|nr:MULTISPECIES: S24/S26 family peptidase [Micromonospora]NES37384.1 peptidase S24 [Micromonospora solifontis]NES58071.1 peptidase S24 [Micromonospora sp. PPF5-6]RNL98392.1 peptidase S24 [Micromonospora solifontis]
MTGWLRRRWRLVVVRGNSMAPTLHDGDRLIVRVGRAPATGDLVVFRARDVVPGADLPWMVKRVQRVEPDGAVTVRGDNPHSQDSRHFGAVPRAAILGVATGRR